jgi:hypothetical protein
LKTLLVIFLCALLGCAKITLNTVCPPTSTGVGFALAGSTVGNTALSMLSTAASGGMLAARAGAPTSTNATMSYEYFPIFGADSGSLSCTQPPTQTTVVTSPPASIVR